MNIHDFIEEFRSVIVASVGRDSNPLYHPRTDRKKIYQLIKSLPRRPIASQIDAIGGIVQALRARDSAILVGEMGLGKTYISIAAAGALGFTKILVVCPPFLVRRPNWVTTGRDTPHASKIAPLSVPDAEHRWWTGTVFP